MEWNELNDLEMARSEFVARKKKIGEEKRKLCDARMSSNERNAKKFDLTIKQQQSTIAIQK